MNCVPCGPQKPVNMTLSEDLVREARRLTKNLSETVETLLADCVDAERRSRADLDRQIDESIRLNPGAPGGVRSLARRVFDALMAQFHVHVAPRRDRTAVPYVVVIESGRFDQLGNRVAIPLMAVRIQPRTEGLIATPSFTIDGSIAYLNPLEIQTAPRSRLGKLAASLADDGSSNATISAIEAVITRAVGWSPRSGTAP